MKSIVPSIENKITILDAGINLNKKGLKNTVKNLFRRVEKSENPNLYQVLKNYKYILDFNIYFKTTLCLYYYL